jgi:hypothetical protein
MDTVATTAVVSPGRSVRKKVGKILKYVWLWTASIVFACLVLDWSWVNSGSSKWKLEIDRDGTQVYSMKVPGDSIVKFRGVTQYGYSYSQMLSAFIDAESFTKDCGKLAAGCLEYRFLKPWDPQHMTNTQYWRTELPSPFLNREVVVNGKIFQNKETKEILLENSAAPSLIPPNDCCVRITQLHNTWKYTPLKNGKVEVEYIQNFSGGGFVPDFLLSFGAEPVYQLMHVDIPKLLDDDKYRNAKLDFIEEYQTSSTVAAR